MNKLKIAGIIVVGIIISLFLFEVFVTIPREEIAAKERAALLERQAAQQAAVTAKTDYNACLADAYKVYSMAWDSKCELEGKGKDCSLLAYEYETIESRYENEKKRCLDIYLTR